MPTYAVLTSMTRVSGAENFRVSRALVCNWRPDWGMQKKLDHPMKIDYPPLGSVEWRRRMERATKALHDSQKEISQHCAAINTAVTKILREFQS